MHNYFGPQRIAIKRETRGIGDMIMMEPVIRALFFANKGIPVDLYLHKHLIDVHKNHPSVGKISVVDDLDGSDYDIVHDLSYACVEYEDTHAPNIEKSRTEIWSDACGLKYKEGGPLLYLDEANIQYGKEYISSCKRLVLGIGSKSIDEFRDYPHMNQLIFELVKKYDLVIIDKRKDLKLENEIEKRQLSSNILQLDSENILDVFGIIGELDLVVSIDSMATHVACALQVPTYAIFGPTAPNVRLDSYKNIVKTPKPFKLCGQQPCWYSVCQGRWCMQTLHPWEITKDIKNMLS